MQLKFPSKWILTMGIFSCISWSVQAQYVDTIKGKLQVFYNDPNKFKVSLLAGIGGDMQTNYGGVILPTAFVEGHFAPTGAILIHGQVQNIFGFGWQQQTVPSVRNYEMGLRIFLSNKTIKKTKSYTAGSGIWNYDFVYPVKVNWRTGLSFSYKTGSGVFNSGYDSTTAVKFSKVGSDVSYFLPRAAILYRFQEFSAGFSLSTRSRMKLSAHIPQGKAKERRMKTFTEFRVEAVYAWDMQFQEMITRRPDPDVNVSEQYKVNVVEFENWGVKMSGFFRRKWLGLKFETGIRPGVYYRFAEGEKSNPLDRSYVSIGVGIGLM